METVKRNVLLMADPREIEQFGVLSGMQNAGYSAYVLRGQLPERPVWWPCEVNLGGIKRAWQETGHASPHIAALWDAFVFLSPTVSLPARNLTETLDISVGEIERTLNWLETVQGVDTLRFVSVVAPSQHPYQAHIMSEQKRFLQKFLSGRTVTIRYHGWKNDGVAMDLPGYFRNKVLDFL